MSTTPFVLQDVQKVPYSISITDKDGLPAGLPAGDVIAPASSDPTIASVVPDAAPAAGTAASGFILGQAKLGTVQVSFPANTAAGAPDTSITPAVVSIQVVAGPGVQTAAVLGTPVAQ